MLCDVCKDGLEGMWDPRRSKRLALLRDFLDNDDDDDKEDTLGSHDAGKYKHFLRPY